MAKEVKVITPEEQRKSGNLPYYKEYCVEDLPFPRTLVCCHLRTTIIEDRKYCVDCGEGIC